MVTTDRHFCWPLSNGTLLVLVMSGLMYAGHWFMFSAFEFSLTGSLRIVAVCTSIGLRVLLPVTVFSCCREMHTKDIHTHTHTQTDRHATTTVCLGAPPTEA